MPYHLPLVNLDISLADAILSDYEFNESDDEEIVILGIQ